MTETLINFQSICQDYGCKRIFILYILFNNLMTVFNVILIQFLLYIFTFHQRQLSLKLSILLFQSSNNNTRINSLISLNIILDKCNSHCELACRNTFRNVVLLCRHCCNHSSFTISSN